MDRRRLAFLVATTLALTFAFVLHARGEWLWDDVYLVQKNPELTEPGGAWSILTRDLWGGATGESTQVYRPVPMLLRWLETQVFGVTLAPMRLVGVVVHTINGALLYVLIRRRFDWSETAAWSAAIVFLLHPSSTETVMWLAAADDLLGVTFTLLAALAFDAELTLGAIAVALACWSKEAFVVVPLLLQLEPLRTRTWRPRHVVPFAGAIAAFAVRFALGIGAGSAAATQSIADQVRAAGTLLVHYVAQVATFRNGPSIETYAPMGLGLAVVALLAYVAVTLYAARRRSPAATALVWFALALAPNLLAIPVTRIFGNRYAYLPLVGFALLVAFGVERLREFAAERANILAYVVVAFAPVLGLFTAGEASKWVSGVALFGADVEQAPNDPNALYQYGSAVVRRQSCREGSVYYARAVEVDPTFQKAWHNLAGCLINLHQYEAAIGPAERALALAPENPRAEYNLGVALGNAGRKAEAITHLERAQALNPHARNIEEALKKARE